MPGSPGRAGPHDRRLGRGRPLVAGLLVAGGGGAAALLLEAAAGVPALPVAVVLGIAAAAVLEGRGGVPERWRPGLAVASRRLLRAGVVLLGLRLAVSDVVGLGWRGALVVTGVLVLALVGTAAVCRAAGLRRGTALLVAAGYAVCGASAVAAVASAVDADEDDVATAVALVTLCGTASVAVLPLLAAPLGLAGEAYGTWVGLAVHDVGQVVATAAVGGAAALDQAVLVKLVRVALLAPVVAVVAVVARRSAAGARRGAPVPLFVVGFLLAAALRSTGALPEDVLEAAGALREALLAAALVALGLAVRPRRLVRTGRRALAAGVVAWVLVGALGLAGTALLR